MEETTINRLHVSCTYQMFIGSYNKCILRYGYSSDPVADCLILITKMVQDNSTCLNLVPEIFATIRSFNAAKVGTIVETRNTLLEAAIFLSHKLAQSAHDNRRNL